METKTNFSLVLLLVLGMFTVFFSVQAKADGSPHGCDQLKETKLSVYFYDYFSGGPNTTDFPIVGFPGKLWRYDQFGTLNVFDDILREGPKLTSPKIGHIQSTYAVVSFDGKNVLVSCSLIFTGGSYNGSTIQILGVVNQFNPIQEYGVTSGTGSFRYATGYSTWENLILDFSASYGLVRVNITIRHY